MNKNDKKPQKNHETPHAPDLQPQKVPEKRYDLHILQSLRRIIRATDIHSRKLASQYKVTGPQLVCLATLAEEEPLTVTSLSKKVFLSKSTVVGIIDRLEQKGMVQRKRDAHDRRHVYITSTAEGKALLEKAPRPLESSVSDSLENLSDLEQLTIAYSLERIVEILEAKDIQAPPYLDTTTTITHTEAGTTLPEIKKEQLQ